MPREAKLAAAASSYCWLTPAHLDPLGEQLVSLAEAIEKAEKGTTHEHDAHLPIRGGDFHRFRLSLPKRSRFVGLPAAAGRPTSSPEARTAEEAAAADAYEASRTGEEREAFGVALSSMQIWYVHPMLTAFLTRTLPEGYESIAGYEEVRHTPWLTPPLTHSLPTYSTALAPQRGWPTCESSWVALAKVSQPACWPPILTLSAPRSTAGRRRLVRRRWRGSSLVSASRRRRAICRWSSRSTRGRSSPSFET